MHPKIRTAVGMAVATIAASDWPHDWPHLMPALLASLSAKDDNNVVAGAVRCLSLFADEIQEGQLAALVPSLFPALYRVASDGEYELSVRRCSLAVVRSCLSSLGMMTGVYQRDMCALVCPMLPSWLHLFASLLSPPLPSEHPEEWGLCLEVLRCMTPILHHFASPAEPHLGVLLASLWGSLVSGQEVFCRAAVDGVEDSCGQAGDEDGASNGLEALVMQSLEFVVTVVGHRRLRVHVEGQLESVLQCCVTYMQMTEEACSDPEGGVGEEVEDGCSCRASACLLIRELVEHMGTPVLRHLAVAAQRGLQGGGRWQLQEAALVAMGSAADALMGEQDPSLREVFEARVFLNRVVAPLMGEGEEEGKRRMEGNDHPLTTPLPSPLQPQSRSPFCVVALSGPYLSSPLPCVWMIACPSSKHPCVP